MKLQLQNTEKRRSFTFMSVLMTMFALVWAMNAQAGTMITFTVQASNGDGYLHALAFSAKNMGYHVEYPLPNVPYIVYHNEFTINWGNGQITENKLIGIGGDIWVCNYGMGTLPYAAGDTAYYTVTVSVPEAYIFDFNCQSVTNITDLNVSDCPSLEYLRCGGNRLTSLDLTDNTVLKQVKCDNNQLTNLDLSNKVLLTEVTCSYNNLTDLNLTGSMQIDTLDCSNNEFTALDFSGRTALTELKCIGNPLATLNVSSCTALKQLDCYDNQLTVLNVGGCTALEHLNCYDNLFTTLNLSECTALGYLHCYNNELTSLILPNNAPSNRIDCKNNHFLLSDLYNISATINNANCYKNYLDQTLPLREIQIGETVDYSAEKEFDGFATDFYVSKLGDGYYQTAVEDEDYNISEGVITFNTPGGYMVSMYNSQGVPNSTVNPTSVTATFTVGDGAGISKTEVTANITVYPNPAKDELRIMNYELRINNVEIVDITGKIIYN